MTRTNAEDFRTHLKDWLEKARQEPVRITRKSGESFVLLGEEAYFQLTSEVSRLQGALLGMKDVLSQNIEPVSKESIKKDISKVKSALLKKRRKKVG